jgi:hypothetical protein
MTIWPRPPPSRSEARPGRDLNPDLRRDGGAGVRLGERRGVAHDVLRVRAILTFYT